MSVATIETRVKTGTTVRITASVAFSCKGENRGDCCDFDAELRLFRLRQEEGRRQLLHEEKEGLAQLL